MKTDEIREKYLSFFESKGCTRRPSDVLVPKWDETVLFTPAGMNQFKDEFLGAVPLKFPSATTCQKCLRTGDISNVGVTSYHHTFFEMLGNFSFGDYFKKEAIHWAWEFLTGKQWMAIDPEQLTVSVYEDANDDKASDHEAFRIWNEEIGLPAERIAWLGEHDNFWPAGAPSDGPDGVCGPCSEIFFHPEDGSGEVEIWNLVFTQYNRSGDPPNNLKPLPSKNIDTGMGLERMASVMQGKTSNFEIDTLRPLCEAAGDAVGKTYAFDAPEGRALRRIADHVRAVTMCVHEGVSPGSEKESYVVRQLLRRAVLEGFMLGKQETFLHTLVPAVVEQLGGPYPEIKETVKSAADQIEAEEAMFLGTIERGLAKFEKCVEAAKSSGSSTISGDAAFDLHQTDGFLIELTQALAAQRNLKVDMKGFEAGVKKHKTTSRADKEFGVMAEGPLDAIRKTHGETTFLGYEATEFDGQVIGILAEGQSVEKCEEVGHADPIALVLDRTPFYAEAGGQVGDVGTITGDGWTFDVLDTQRKSGLICHLGHLKSGVVTLDAKATATVDADRRAGIRRAHSATHLLHHALRMTLGDDATQRGSKVEDDQLRFDFAHGRALEAAELERIEDEVNARIADGAAVDTRDMPLKEARELGAMALFGEKYPDVVRVVRMGEFSTELCGGTHLANTGQVGFCRVLRDEPVAGGVRRVVAVTGRKALGHVREAESLLGDLQKLVKAPTPGDLPQRVATLQVELKAAKADLAKFTKQSVAGEVDSLVAAGERVGDTVVVTHHAEGVGRDGLREFADQIRSKAGSAAVLVGTVVDDKVALVAAVSKDLVKKGVKAGDCVKVAAKVVGGGGGGRPDLAEAGGKDPSKLPEALEAARAFYREALG